MYAGCALMAHKYDIVRILLLQNTIGSFLNAPLVDYLQYELQLGKPRKLLLKTLCKYFSHISRLLKLTVCSLPYPYIP